MTAAAEWLAWDGWDPLWNVVVLLCLLWIGNLLESIRDELRKRDDEGRGP